MENKDKNFSEKLASMVAVYHVKVLFFAPFIIRDATIDIINVSGGGISTIFS